MNFLKLSRNNVPVLVDTRRILIVEPNQMLLKGSVIILDNSLSVHVDESPTEIYHMLLIRIGKDPAYES